MTPVRSSLVFPGLPGQGLSLVVRRPLPKGRTNRTRLGRGTTPPKTGRAQSHLGDELDVPQAPTHTPDLRSGHCHPMGVPAVGRGWVLWARRPGQGGSHGD